MTCVNQAHSACYLSYNASLSRVPPLRIQARGLSSISIFAFHKIEACAMHHKHCGHTHESEFRSFKHENPPDPRANRLIKHLQSCLKKVICLFSSSILRPPRQDERTDNQASTGEGAHPGYLVGDGRLVIFHMSDPCCHGTIEKFQSAAAQECRTYLWCQQR